MLWQPAHVCTCLLVFLLPPAPLLFLSSTCFFPRVLVRLPRRLSPSRRGRHDAEPDGRGPDGDAVLHRPLQPVRGRALGCCLTIGCGCRHRGVVAMKGGKEWGWRGVGGVGGRWGRGLLYPVGIPVFLSSASQRGGSRMRTARCRLLFCWLLSASSALDADWGLVGWRRRLCRQCAH